ncbi:MAG: phage head morphogenesis protein [Kiritimatiellae bacterium]|nr:phage head morphogenesis protein [Kiritimatiellia bacterium]
MTANLTIETFPNEAAAAYIRGKAVADPKNFGALPDQLKQRAFTVAGIEQMDVLRRIREAIAKLPEGASWDEAKKEIAAEMSPYVPAKDGRSDMKAARARAEFTLRSHGFQAYSVARHQEQMATIEDFPYWKYETVGDGKVRASHAALDGKVLRADDPWWKTHYPPWDWGCRCIVVALDEEDAEEIGISERKDMPTPGHSESFAFDPTNVAIDLEKYRKDPRFETDTDWQLFFVNPAKNVTTERTNGTKCTMWELCMDTKYAPIAQSLAKLSRKDGKERSILIDALTGAKLETHIGGANEVATGQTLANGAKTATLHTHTRLAAYPSPSDLSSSLAANSAFDYIAVPGQLRRIDRGDVAIDDADKQAILEFKADNDRGHLNKKAWSRFVEELIAKGVIKMVRAV